MTREELKERYGLDVSKMKFYWQFEDKPPMYKLAPENDFEDAKCSKEIGNFTLSYNVKDGWRILIPIGMGWLKDYDSFHDKFKENHKLEIPDRRIIESVKTW